jgi:hypothetical protein
MRRIGISIAALLVLALVGCQGDDNSLPPLPDAGAGDAKQDVSAPRDGSGDSEASHDAAVVDATEDLGPLLDDGGGDADGGADAGSDASADAGSDASADGASDASADAASDASADSGSDAASEASADGDADQ